MTKNTVQVKNPKTNRYVKIDKTKGIIVSHKKTPGPYKNVAIAKKGGSQVNIELEALRVLKANAILFDDGTDFGASMLEAISDLEKALTPPTADEVREAILTSPHIIAVKYYNKENDFVCYNDIGFCTSAKNMELRHFSKKALLYLARFDEGLDTDE